MSRHRPPAGIGAKLQEARKRQGVSLRQVADTTKISVSTLQALERNDISRLPGGVVGRGFVRSFAAAVGLDPEATVAEFVAQFPLESVTDGYPAAEHVDENVVPDSRPTEASSKIPLWQDPTLLRLAAIGVLPAALVVYFATSRGRPQRPVMHSGSATAQAGAAGTFVPLGSPGKKAVQAPSPGEIGGKTQHPGEPPARPAATDLPEPVPLAKSSAEVDTGGNPDTGAPAGDRLAVVLSVTSPSWVIVTVDGKKTINRLLQVGEQEMLEARRDLVVTAGDAGAIVMTLNGTVAKSLGQSGETMTVRLNRRNFRDYLPR